MTDITIIGDGSAARACMSFLPAAGFAVRRTFAFDNDDRSPIVLGELPSALTVARQAVEAGRHLLIANPSQFTPERLGLLYEGRRKAQALCLWSTRRYHPSYRFISNLIESDSTWQPRYMRHETLLTETPSVALANWTLVEAAALVVCLAGDAPLSVAATSAANATRNANELMILTIEFPGLRAFMQVGLGEAMGRRETLIAGHHRKVFVDELNPSVPVRLITDEPGGDVSTSARWLSTSAPTADDMARQQCLVFLDSASNSAQAQDEAALWTQAFAVVVAARQSLVNAGAAMQIERRDSEGPRFRIIA